MWSAKVSSLSRVTPKSRTLDKKVKPGKVEAISLIGIKLLQFLKIVI